MGSTLFCDRFGSLFNTESEMKVTRGNQSFTGGKSFLRRVFLIGLLMFVVFEVPAQNEEETLLQIVEEHKGDTTEVKSLNSLYRLYRKADTEKAMGYLEDAMTLAYELDFQRGIALVCRSYGDFYNSRGDHAKALEALNKSKAIYEDLSDWNGTLSCLNGLGNLATRQGNFTLALEYYLSAARLSEEMGFDQGVSSAYQNIGGIHYRQQRFDKALDYIQKSLKLKESLGDSVSMVPTLNALSVVYTAQGDYSKALEIQFRTLGIARRFNDRFQSALVLNNIGVQYHYLNKPDSAKYYYLQALAINKRLDEKQEVSTLYINLGELECLLGNGQKAITYYDSSLAIAKEIGGLQYQAESYRGLSNAYEVLGDFEQVHYWSSKYHSLKDSLSGEGVKLKINELQEKYESGQKDKEIAELKEKEAEAVSTAEKRKSFLTIAISGTLLLVLLSVGLVGRSRAKEKQRRIVLEQKALRSQMNPHFIFNSLGAIQSMYMSGETDLANNYMGDFGKLMRKILENSGKDSISVKEELEMLTLYLNLERERNDGLVDYEFSIDERIDQYGTYIPPMVIQPFIENAIWHGILPSKKKGKVNVRLTHSEKAGVLLCVVEDNGVGLTRNKGKKDHISKGINITEQRLGSKVKFSNLSPGTRVTIQIPI